MKFLKLYESFDLNPRKPKFKKGQRVRIITKADPINGWKSDPYTIKEIKFDFSYVDGVDNYFYKLEVYDIWRNEDTLEAVPDYEIEADKYNL